VKIATAAVASTATQSGARERLFVGTVAAGAAAAIRRKLKVGKYDPERISMMMASFRPSEA
jgi:hypothetical protein